MSQFTKTELSEMTREEFIEKIKAEYENYKTIHADDLVEQQLEGFRDHGKLISAKETLLLSDIEAFIKVDNPDSGAYCGGMSISVSLNNRDFLFAEPIAQGNVTNELYFDLIQKIFTDRKFVVNLGNMI